MWDVDSLNPRNRLCQISSLLHFLGAASWKLGVPIDLSGDLSTEFCCDTPSPPLDNIRVMVNVWRLRGNIVRTALCWIVSHNVHSPQHTYVSSSYRFNRLGLSHCDPYVVRRGGCLELYYCNMAEWFWCDSSLISTTNWFPSVLWHCWFGHLACKNRPRNDPLCVEWNVKPYTLTLLW